MNLKPSKQMLEAEKKFKKLSPEEQMVHQKRVRQSLIEGGVVRPQGVKEAK